VVVDSKSTSFVIIEAVFVLTYGRKSGNYSCFCLFFFSGTKIWKEEKALLQNTIAIRDFCCSCSESSERMMTFLLYSILL
jgi:hypothetical protein